MAAGLPGRRYLANAKRCGQLNCLSEKDCQGMDSRMTEILESMENLIGAGLGQGMDSPQATGFLVTICAIARSGSCWMPS